MAAAARCMRSLLRNPSNLNASARSIIKCLNSSTSAKAVTSLSLRSSLKETGLLNGSKNYSLTTKGNFMKSIRPVTTLCNLVTVALIDVDATGSIGDGVDCTVGDDDGETWSQNSDDDYISDDT